MHCKATKMSVHGAKHTERMCTLASGGPIARRYKRRVTGTADTTKGGRMAQPQGLSLQATTNVVHEATTPRHHIAPCQWQAKVGQKSVDTGC